MFIREIKEKNTKNKYRENRKKKAELKKEEDKQKKEILTKNIFKKKKKKRINGRKPSSKTVKTRRHEKTKN